MSVSLILQDESKKTLGGYLFLFLTFTTTVTLHFFNFDSSEVADLIGFISTFFLISSFLSLSFITIRPENYFNRFLFGKEEIPPFFKASDTLPIVDRIYSPLMSKERDNFWGNFLIAVGFIIGLSIPVNKIITNEMYIFVEYGKIFICLVTASAILYNWYINQKKEVRERLEITWRYIQIISQIDRTEHYLRQINSLEDSIKLRLWDKARYQIEDLNKFYMEDLRKISSHADSFKSAYAFLLGDETSSEHKLNFGDLRDSFKKAKVLGLEFHNKLVSGNLEDMIRVYGILDSELTKHANLITNEKERILKIIQNDLDLKAKGSSIDFSTMKDEIHRFFYDINAHLFHIESHEVKYDKFESIINYFHEYQNPEAIKQFERLGNPNDFWNRFTKNARESFKDVIKKELGTEPNESINTSIKEVEEWLKEIILKNETYKLV